MAEVMLGYLGGTTLGVFWVIWKQVFVYKDEPLFHLITDVIKVVWFPVAIPCWACKKLKRRKN